MPRKDDEKQIYATLSEQDMQGFTDYVKKNGLSKNAAINQAIKLLLTDTLKEQVPDQAGSIDNFEYLVGSIVDAYRIAVSQAASATDKARDAVREELKGMEALAATNASLTESVQKLTAENVKLEANLVEAEQKIKQLQEDLADAKTNVSDTAALREELAAMKSQLAEARLQHSEEIEKIRKDNFQQIIEIIKAK